MKLIGWLVAIAILVPAFAYRGSWFPGTEGWVKRTIGVYRQPGPATEQGHGTDGKDGGHAHEGHSGHDDATSLELSEQALGNLGLTSDYIQPVKLTTYRRSITVPAVITERPGRTRLQVATPMTGVIRHVHAVAGEAVKPGTLLFEIRLTHEDLVLAQTSFLQTLGELDVERREIVRLTEATKTGAIPRVKLLEREYASEKLEALLSAQQEALRLHGLSTEQVEQIAATRRLLRELQVFAPSPDEHSENELKLARRQVQPVVFQPAAKLPNPAGDAAPLVISELRVHKGQSVDAGETLCTLSDYSKLNVEGLAFEQDAGSIAAAAQRQWTVRAVFEEPNNQRQTLDDLPIIRLSNEIDTVSRTLHFYVALPNWIESKTESEDGRYFVGWRYRPGQRLQLEVPIEEWPNEIVLPVESVTKEGAEFYAFQQNGDHFDRVAVHVKYRDQSTVVIANDGTLFPGDVVAWRCAHQMQMALKNKSGGGVDPHAGHNH
ncbi:MAG: efflux RND transporter periplasmic adaptor subunit [Rhodopirellula sp.]|nr:efflux RND transporter periplasmic adaptor subunit [Rhodopirellula sp.]